MRKAHSRRCNVPHAMLTAWRVHATARAPRTNRRVTLNGGMAMPAWYDIFSLEAGEGREDKAGLDESAQVVRALVKGEEEAGIPASRILIGGFSQGGAVALYTVLTASHDAPPARRLAGVISLSAYVPCAKEIAPAPEEAGPAVAARLPPVFMAHGSADLVVKYDWHRKSVSFLTDRIGMALTPSRPARGGELTVKVYKGMAHCACSEEIDDVATFVASCLDA